MDSYLRIKRSITPIEAETIFSVGDFPITNSTLMLFVVILLVILAGILLKRWININPGRFQNTIEILYEKLIGAVMGITGTRERAEKIFPLIGAIFVFIILSNSLSFLPGLSSLTFDGKNIFRTATSDFNTTFGLAVVMVGFIQFINIKEVGIFEYIGKFFQFGGLVRGFRKGIGEGFVSVINFFIGLLDIVSEFAKVVSLSLRLFGNMFASEVLATVIIGGLAFGLPAIWMSMSMLSGVVQTLVFSFLVTAYYTMALKPLEKKSGSENKQTV